MSKPTAWSLNVIRGLHEFMLDDGNPLALAEFAEVSASMMDGYARFVSIGLPEQTIALAMLGATINLYEMFGIRDDLPELLRVMANRIEADSTSN
jgi:hypothetical protein